MPRPRAFDTDDALDAALATFWRLGYASTTLTDLTDAMGIARPSLYNAFGDKRALFLTALDRYAAGYAPLLAALEVEADGRFALDTFLRAVAEGLADSSHPAGCLRVGHTALNSDPDLAEPLAAAHSVIEVAIRKRLERAQADLQLDPTEDAATLAAFFVGAISAMAVRSRLDRDPSILIGIAERTMRAWTSP